MPTPTYAQLASAIQAYADTWETIRLHAESNSDNVAGLLTTLDTAIGGRTDYPELYAAAAQSIRQATVRAMAACGGFLTPWLRDYGRFLDKPNADASQIPALIYQDFIDNSRRVKSRAPTVDAPSANGSNVGDGTVVRLSKDARGFVIETLRAEAKKATCIQDQNSGVEKGQEVFLFEGADASKDGLETLGSGAQVPVTVSLPRKDSILLNSSFDSRGGTDTGPTSITSWSSSVTVNSTNFGHSTSVVYCPAPDDNTTIRSLIVKASATLVQKLSERRSSLNTGGAYHCAVGWNGSAGAACGTLVLRCGTQAVSVSVTSQTGWNVLALSADLNSWYENLNTNDFSVRVQWTKSAGNIFLDDVWFVPFNFDFDGTGYVLRASSTPFLARHPALDEGDQYEWSDAISSDSKIQRMLATLGGFYLPHSTSATLADP